MTERRHPGDGISTSTFEIECFLLAGRAWLQASHHRRLVATARLAASGHDPDKLRVFLTTPKLEEKLIREDLSQFFEIVGLPKIMQFEIGDHLRDTSDFE
jgi:hypothetical protein